jgi:hypothetical protein
MIETYINEFRISVMSLLAMGNMPGEYFSRCCCEYIGPNHSKFVEELADIMVQETMEFTKAVSEKH